MNIDLLPLHMQDGWQIWMKENQFWEKYYDVELPKAEANFYN